MVTKYSKRKIELKSGRAIKTPGGKKKSSKTDTTSQALKLKREVYSREIPHGLTHEIKSLLLFSPLETRSNGLSCWVFNLL